VGTTPRPSVTCQRLNCLSDFMEVGIGALYSRAGVRRNGLRDRRTVLNGVNESEPGKELCTVEQACDEMGSGTGILY
jgi:hypothetical protein